MRLELVHDVKSGAMAHGGVVDTHGVDLEVLVHVGVGLLSPLVLHVFFTRGGHAHTRVGVRARVPAGERPPAGGQELLELFAVAFVVQHGTQLRHAHLHIEERHDVQDEPPDRVTQTWYFDEGQASIVGHRLERRLPELVEQAALQHVVQRNHFRDDGVLLRGNRDLGDADVEVVGRQTRQALHENLLDDDMVRDVRVQRVNLQDSNVVLQAVYRGVGHLLVQVRRERGQPGDVEPERRIGEDGLSVDAGLARLVCVHF
ncbi:hypothetical protein BOVATA_004110 [Babesia ovata]|uniref:Uncharacterized protein n=1 Tax=Babesia ovata TaxID=189622 RepID=A0A2H6K7G5_9APIC|nr:uncharacterized protein BOVATA_004110 [Babesia ovata]GBE58918.1 hypothetical protein BOVATA_004110 [Babesia ovata]